MSKIKVHGKVILQVTVVMFFTVNFEQISYAAPTFPFLILKK